MVGPAGDAGSRRRRGDRRRRNGNSVWPLCLHLGLVARGAIATRRVVSAPGAARVVPYGGGVGPCDGKGVGGGLVGRWARPCHGASNGAGSRLLEVARAWALARRRAPSELCGMARDSGSGRVVGVARWNSPLAGCRRRSRGTLRPYTRDRRNRALVRAWTLMAAPFIRESKSPSSPS